jgi:hypothetical protein
MSYKINGVPVCGIQFGFFGRGNYKYTDTMLSHGPNIYNDFPNSNTPWLRVPVPLKVYAISLTTDNDDDTTKRTFTFQVRKDTGATYTWSSNNGSNIGTSASEGTSASVTFSSITNFSAVNELFTDTTTNPAPTFAKGESIGLLLSTNTTNATQENEFTVKLWCYQI